MNLSFRTALKVFLWVGSIGAVIAVGLIFLPREYPALGFWESLYYTLRLFVFEQDLPHFPRMWPLILIYFAAPVIALSAAGTAVTYAFRLSPRLRTRWISDHVIICGLGRTGKLIAGALRKRGISVVGVDMSPAENFDEWSSENRVPVFIGDFESRALLARAGARRARALIFASGDDLANLEGSVGAYDWLRSDRGPVRLIWAHVANERLADTARRAVRTRGVVGIRFFDTYRLAATRMVSRCFNSEVRRGVTEATLIGFGKFGRDLFEIMVRDLGPDENFFIGVIDKHDREAEVTRLATDLGVSERVSFLRANISELDLVDEPDKAYFLCTDDDLGNLTMAMMLASKLGATNIYVRMTAWPLSAMAEHLGEEAGVTFVNIADLMVQGVETLPGIFEPAREKDLKRVDRSSQGTGSG